MTTFNPSLDLGTFRSVGNKVNRRLLTPLTGARSSARDLICFDDGGALLFEGDILLRPAPMTGIFGRLMEMTPFGNVMTEQESLWPGGIVPYTAEYSVEALVGEAISHWKARTPIRFKAYAGEDDFVAFRLVVEMHRV